MDDSGDPLGDLNDDISKQVEFFSTGDDKLKFLGEILSNDSSRSILVLLINQEMSADDISKKTNLRLSLVIHHLNKMQMAGIVSINKIGKNTKNHDVKYYSAKPGILILPKDASDRASKSKTLHHSMKRVLRFAAIGLAGLVSWMLVKPMVTTQYSLIEPGETSTGADEAGILLPLTISLTVIVIGMVVERTLFYIENKRKM